MSSQAVALVTGASQGIGRATSLRLANDGFDVAINDMPNALENLESLAKEIRELGRKAEIVIADISVEDEVKGLISDVVQKLGSLDVMVANAGICIAKSIRQTSVEDWDRMFSVNARGTFMCYRYAAEQMIVQGKGGRIIGACSLAGKQGQESVGAYSSTKFAIRGLTQSAAKEFGQFGITVNAYAPGAIDTPMYRNVATSLGTPPEVQISELTKLGYIGTPADIAGVVSYLASKEARFITGQTISINGGVYFD